MIVIMFSHRRNIAKEGGVMQWGNYSSEPAGQAFPSAGNGTLPCRPPPDPLQGRLFQRSGPERFLQIQMPALSTTRFPGVRMSTNQ